LEAPYSSYGEGGDHEVCGCVYGAEGIFGSGHELADIHKTLAVKKANLLLHVDAFRSWPF
jgi:hypothetical protein